MLMMLMMVIMMAVVMRMGKHDNVCGGDNRDDHGDSKDDHNVGGNGDGINKDHLQHTITRTTAMRMAMT